MGIAEKLPPYIPPPWRQKNPIMEKACPAYHRNTAPARFVEVMKEFTVLGYGKETEPEVVKNSEYFKHNPNMTVLWKLSPEFESQNEYPLVASNFRWGNPDKKEDVAVTFGVIGWWEVKIKWKGKTLKSAGRGKGRLTSMAITSEGNVKGVS